MTMTGSFYDKDMSKVDLAIRELRLEMEKHLNETLEVPFTSLTKQEQAQWLKRDRELHPSSFPYCGLRDAYERLERRDNDFMIPISFANDFFLNVGTVAHTALQRWVGRNRKIVGNWICGRCKFIHQVQIRPRKCSKCRAKDFDYEELGGQYRRYVFWHTDGLYKDKRSEYWVIDYKTSTKAQIEKHREKGNVFPYNTNKIQIETYAILLAKKLGIKIRGWILIYVSRDNPNYMFEHVGGEMDSDRREVVEKHLKTSDKIFPIVLEATTSSKFDELRKVKLCSSMRYYEKNVHSYFSECPLAKRECCFDKERLKAKIGKALRKYEKRNRETTT